ncbi:hypothetical protein OBBRIDRAFT_838959 [Obba rivulosa]|uniref:PiggyBac transposable element-derived protein domain-containing protein n=1 Tax=Obba rivulosa TaxID=1052685 RepID=A0A8E2DG22_9APHY|nr:hypothetical protein OBBRIDRAFT_838959 [Obba rivulosa]
MSKPEGLVHSAAEVSDNSVHSSQENSSQERRDTAWMPPKLSAGDMEYTIRKLMPLDDHRRNNKRIFDNIITLRGTCPSPEDIINNVDTATCFLLLVMWTAAPNIPLKPEWRNLDNLHTVAEQEILRRFLAEHWQMRFKTFMRMRSLGLWYQGY